jgi:predicted RNA-binding protein with PUA-like domain
MNYWLCKSDPEAYGWAELVRDKKTDWTGVRNYAARLHLRGMKKGDLVLFYHSGTISALVGIARVTKEAFPDPTAEGDEWVAVGLAAVAALKREIPLSEVKKNKNLKNMALVRISRLSVQPVTEAEFNEIVSMAK